MLGNALGSGSVQIITDPFLETQEHTGPEHCLLLCSVADPNPDPYVFGPIFNFFFDRDRKCPEAKTKVSDTEIKSTPSNFSGTCD
jgi:hypothetical protein